MICEYCREPMAPQRPTPWPNQFPKRFCSGRCRLRHHHEKDLNDEQIEQRFMAAKTGKKTHKYRAVPTEVDGVRFASKREAKRYQELKLLERAGEISDLVLQPAFTLTVQLTTGTLRGALKATAGKYPVIGKYVADFAYRDKYENRVIEDVKGFKTPLYRWKKKHVEAQYGIQVREV